MPHATESAPAAGRLTVRGTRLWRDGRPFFVSGMNYWAGPTLARAGFHEGGTLGWDRVRRDLDALQAAGVNLVRTMAATEGPDSEPYRIVPTIQPAPGRYDPVGVAGVVRFADELRARGIHGIFTLNNFWPWSGGFAQYVAWAGQGAIPYPPPAPRGSWSTYQRFAARFYDDPRAQQLFRAFVAFLVPKLEDNPAVIWELANEPRGVNAVPAFRRWVDGTARFIKSLAPTQLVTTGSEGETPTPWFSGLDLLADHGSPAIDFACFHMWAQNWGWLGDSFGARDVAAAIDRAKAYVRRHAALGAKLGKPILLEELGFPRDDTRYDPAAPTTFRDLYLREVVALVTSLIPSTPIAGLAPWAWAGAARPPRPGGLWAAGDPFTGDPPHERQGWYSLYDTDSTAKLLGGWSRDIAAAGAAAMVTADAATSPRRIPG